MCMPLITPLSSDFSLSKDKAVFSKGSMHFAEENASVMEANDEESGMNSSPKHTSLSPWLFHLFLLFSMGTKCEVYFDLLSRCAGGSAPGALHLQCFLPSAGSAEAATHFCPISLPSFKGTSDWRGGREIAVSV